MFDFSPKEEKTLPKVTRLHFSKWRFLQKKLFLETFLLIICANVARSSVWAIILSEESVADNGGILHQN